MFRTRGLVLMNCDLRFDEEKLLCFNEAETKAKKKKRICENLFDTKIAQWFESIDAANQRKAGQSRKSVVAITYIVKSTGVIIRDVEVAESGAHCW